MWVRSICHNYIVHPITLLISFLFIVQCENIVKCNKLIVCQMMCWLSGNQFVCTIRVNDKGFIMAINKGHGSSN